VSAESTSAGREPFLVWLVAHRRVPLGFAAAVAVYWFATPHLAAIVIGCLVALPGQALRIWGAGHLHKAREVTSSGPYRFMRHPLYIGSSIMGVGFAIAAGSIVSAIVVVLYLAITIPVTARREEMSLDRNLDGAYAAYREGRGGDPNRPFSWAQVRANHEARSLVGFVLAIALLVVRMQF
jgi:protein-S-isoprenylcysteine O-methyltransferase Ste14